MSVPVSHISMAELHQFDDPLNPQGWGAEPMMRRLRLTFPDLNMTVHPIGIIDSWETYSGPEIPGGRSAMAAVCARVSEESGMPIDEYLWFENPPSSSMLAAETVAAAGIIDEEAMTRLLRMLREATFVRRRNIAEKTTLREIVARVSDPNVVFDAVADDSGAAELTRHREMLTDLDVENITDASDLNRPELPTLVVRGNETIGVAGRADFDTYCQAVTAATDLTPCASRPDVAEVLELFSPEGWIATAELASLAGVTYDEAAATAANRNEVVERTFAAESFWRTAAHVPDKEDGKNTVDNDEDR
jgi:protein-disulfide isomerase-like protein with CxxC motif